MDTFNIELEFLEEAGQKARLLTPMERRGFQFRVDEGAEDAGAALRILEADAAARDAGSVTTWTATFREPSYRDRLGISAVALNEARSFATANHVEVTTELVAVFLEDAQARILFRELVAPTGSRFGLWEALEPDIRADLSRLLNTALSVPEADRLPLFAPSTAAT